jgi:hypothetical protein
MSETPARTMCPFTLEENGWVEMITGDGTYVGKSLIDGSRISSEDQEGLITQYEVQKSIALRKRALYREHGSWTAALAAYEKELGPPPYHSMVLLREPFLTGVLNDLRVHARKEAGF